MRSFPALMTIPALMTLLLTGCFFLDGDHGGYGNDCWDCYGWDTGDYDYDANNNDNNDDARTAISVNPDEIAPGEVSITSIVSNGAVSFEGAVEVDIFGDIYVIAIDTHNDQVIVVTIYAAVQATEGPVDVLITYANGASELLEGALAITGDTPSPRDEDSPCG